MGVQDTATSSRPLPTLPPGASPGTIYAGPRGGLFTFTESGKKRYLSSYSESARQKFKHPDYQKHYVIKQNKLTGKFDGTVVFTRDYPTLHGKGGKVTHVASFSKLEVGPIKSTYVHPGGGKRSIVTPHFKKEMSNALFDPAIKLAFDTRGPVRVFQEDGLEMAQGVTRNGLVAWAYTASGALRAAGAGVVIDATVAICQGDLAALGDVALSAIPLMFGIPIPLDVSIFKPDVRVFRAELGTGTPIEGMSSSQHVGVGINGLASGGINSTSSSVYNPTANRLTEDDYAGAYVNVGDSVGVEYGLGVRRETTATTVQDQSTGLQQTTENSVSTFGETLSVRIADRQITRHHDCWTNNTATTKTTSAIDQDPLKVQTSSHSVSIEQAGTGAKVSVSKLIRQFETGVAAPQAGYKDATSVQAEATTVYNVLAEQEKSSTDYGWFTDTTNNTTQTSGSYATSSKATVSGQSRASGDKFRMETQRSEQGAAVNTVARSTTSKTVFCDPETTVELQAPEPMATTTGVLQSSSGRDIPVEHMAPGQQLANASMEGTFSQTNNITIQADPAAPSTASQSSGAVAKALSGLAGCGMNVSRAHENSVPARVDNNVPTPVGAAPNILRRDPSALGPVTTNRLEVETGSVQRTTQNGHTTSIHQSSTYTYNEDTSLDHGPVTTKIGKHTVTIDQREWREGQGSRVLQGGSSGETSAVSVEQGTYHRSDSIKTSSGNFFARNEAYQEHIESGTDRRAFTDIDDELFYESALTGTTDIQYRSSHNLFFSRYNSSLIVRDGNGNVISDHTPSTKYALSPHSAAALRSAGTSALGGGINALVSTGRQDIGRVGLHALEAGGLAFTSSVAADALSLTSLVDNQAAANAIASTGVNAAYKLVLGDAAAAQKLVFENTASYLVSQAANLTDATGAVIPITVGRTHLRANGQLFGSGIVYADTRRDEATIPIYSLTRGGIHYDKIHSITRNRDGTYTERRAHELGVHASSLGQTLSLGAQSGFESTSAVTSTDEDGIVTSTWSDRKFVNELTLTANVGDRQASVKVLPALKETKRSYEERHREDGGDLETHTDLKTKYMQASAAPAKTTPSAGSSASGVKDSADSSVALAPEHTAGAASVEVAEAHQAIADALISNTPAEGRTEHVKSITKETVRKKVLGIQYKKRHHEHKHGIAEENHTAKSAGVSDDGKTLYTKSETKTVLSEFHDRDGKRESETRTRDVYSSRQVETLSNGEAYATRETSAIITADSSDVSAYGHASKASDGSATYSVVSDGSVERTESDNAKITDKQVITEADQPDNIISQQETHSMFGTAREVEFAPSTTTYSTGAITSRSMENTQVVKVRTESYVDTPADANSTATDASSSGTSSSSTPPVAVPPGMRVTSGIETATVSHTSASRSLFTGEASTVETTTSTAYTSNTAVENGERQYTAPDDPGPLAAAPENADLIASTTAPGVVTMNKTTSKSIGFLTSKTKTTTQAVKTADDGSKSVDTQTTQAVTLNQGASRAAGIFIASGLDLVWDKLQRFLRYQEKKKNGFSDEELKGQQVTVSEIFRDSVRLTADMGEGYVVASATELASLTSSLGDAVPAIASALLIGRLIKIGCDISDPRKGALDKDAGTQALAVTCDIVRAGVQFSLIATRSSNAGALMFGASQLISGVQSFVMAIRKGGFNWPVIKSSGLELLATVGKSGVATLASMGAAALGTSILATLGFTGVLPVALATIVVPSVVYWGTNRLISWLWGSPEERELKSLMAELEIPKTASVKEVQRIYRQKLKAVHPDKNGTHEDFIRVTTQFERLLELRDSLGADRKLKKDSALNRMREALRGVLSTFKSMSPWGQDTTAKAEAAEMVDGAVKLLTYHEQRVELEPESD